MKLQLLIHCAACHQGDSAPSPLPPYRLPLPPSSSPPSSFTLPIPSSHPFFLVPRPPPPIPLLPPSRIVPFTTPPLTCLHLPSPSDTGVRRLRGRLPSGLLPFFSHPGTPRYSQPLLIALTHSTHPPTLSTYSLTHSLTLSNHSLHLLSLFTHTLHSLTPPAS